MNCAICGQSMDEAGNNEFKHWVCHKCGWKIRVPAWMAMKFYWEHARPIDDEIIFDAPSYEMEYNTPTIRDMRKFIGADIGDFITAELDDGESYQILIKLIKKKRAPSMKEPFPPCREICADPDLMLVTNNGMGTDREATQDRARAEWERIRDCPLRERFACKHTIPSEFK